MRLKSKPCTFNLERPLLPTLRLEKTMQQRLWNPKTLSTLLLSLFASLSVQAVVQQGINKTEIVVGTIQDLSGPLAGYGKPARNGMQLRIEELNEQGGVHGRRIKLLVEEGMAVKEGQELAVIESA